MRWSLLYFSFFPKDNGGCDHTCLNVAGSYNCSCKSNYELADNGRTCEGRLCYDKPFAPLVLTTHSGLLDYVIGNLSGLFQVQYPTMGSDNPRKSTVL